MRLAEIHDIPSGMTSKRDETCACGRGPVSPDELIACFACWERIGGTLLRLQELGILADVRRAVGGELTLAFALARLRNEDKPATLARGRLVRAVWDRVRERRFSRAQVCVLLGVTVERFEAALREA